MYRYLPFFLALGACQRIPAVEDTDPGLALGAVDSGDAADVEPLVLPPLQLANDRDYLWTAGALIRHAQRRVRVIAYVIYDEGSAADLVDELVGAARRGVDVQVLADEEGSGTVAALDRLSAAGAVTRLDSPTVTTHNKLILVDDVALLGSHNLTSSALDLNTEGSIQVAIPSVAAFYQSYFDALWESPTGVGTLPPPAPGAVVPLYDRQIAPALLACMNGATERVDLVLYALSYRPDYPDSEVSTLLSALVAAHERGVAVRVVLDHSAWIADNTINDDALRVLVDAGVPTRSAPSDTVTHAKVLACDDTVIVSDANWSHSGLELYNGTSLQATDVDLSAEHRAWFEGIWGSATPPR